METVLDTLPGKIETEAEKEARVEFLESVRRAEMTKIKALEKYINALKRQPESLEKEDENLSATNHK